MTVAFIHVPKAAGTSYLQALATQIPGEHYVVRLGGETSAEEFQRTVDPESLRRFSFVAGHFDYGLVLRADFLRPVTVLRDPVDRLVSWYHYVRRTDAAGTRPWRQFIEGRNLSVEDFLLHPTLQRLLGQSQTTQLAGYESSGRPFPAIDQIVAEAQEHLIGLAHLGLYERLGDSLRLAQVELGLDEVPTLPQANVSPPRPGLDPEVREAVADRIGLDAAFYRFAAAQFDERLAASGLDPSPPAPASAPARPPTLAPPIETSPVDCAPRSSDAVGDEIALSWSPPAGTPLGTVLAEYPPVAALRLDTVAARGGSSFVVAAPDEVGTGVNWVGVPHGVYLVQATVPCRPVEGGVTAKEWTVAFSFAWLDDPPIPFDPGGPGAPDLEVWRHLSIPAGLPTIPARGVPVSAEALVRVPDDGGHLCCLMGSSVPVVSCPGDTVTVDYVRIG